MKTGIVIAACLAAGVAQAQNCRQPSQSAPWMLVQKQTLSEEDGAWKSEAFRKLLMSAAAMKTAGVAPQLGWEDQAAPAPAVSPVVDSLKALAATRGSVWPTRAIVGLAGVRAVFILAHSDTALARAALKRMMESGPDEAIKPDVAVLEDRVRLMSGRKQLYGTQLAKVDGKYAPLAIEDSAHVDLRREGANLPPLRWSVCNANSR